MSKHRVVSAKGRHAVVAKRAVSAKHRGPKGAPGGTVLRRGVIAALVLAVLVPAIDSAAAKTHGPQTSNVSAVAGQLSTARESGRTLADRDGRPSPSDPLPSDPLASDPLLSESPLLASPIGSPSSDPFTSFGSAAPTEGSTPTTTRVSVPPAAADAAPTVAPAKHVAAAPKTTLAPPAAITKPPTKVVVAPVAPVAVGPAGYPFGNGSVWRQGVASAAIASNSSTLVGTLSNDVTSLYNGVAAFNVDDYNTTFFSVAAGTPVTNVIYDDCQSKGYEPDGLAAEFANVPIPSNAVPANGTDGEMTIYDAATNQLWEFWQANHQSDGWHACFGGRIDDVSGSPGYFSGGWGATATGLPVAGGMISIADAQAGVINHAMSLEIPYPAVWTDVSYPAQRSDGGNNSASAIPEGTRFRLDPSIDVNSLNLTPLAKMIARAAQTYGFIVTDTAGAVAVQTESGLSVASDPWPGLLGGTPSYQIMANFPWSSLQALPKNWGE